MALLYAQSLGIFFDESIYSFIASYSYFKIPTSLFIHLETYNKLITMNMIPPPPTSANPPERLSTYTVVTFDTKNYRILTKQHRAYLAMSSIWAVFWFLFAAALIGTALILKFQLKLPFIILVCFCFHLPFTIYAFWKRAHFTNSIFYSSLNLFVCMIPIFVLTLLEIKQVMIPLCFYILVQTLISFQFMKNKSQMVAKFLILMEAMMIALKVDDKIQSSWKDVLFSHVVFFIFLSLCIIFMTVYLFYMKCMESEQNLMKYKFTGALFIYINTISFCTLSTLPLIYVLMEIQAWIVCGSIAILLFFNSAFTYNYKKSIVIFFCTLNQIKSFNQIISFQPIEGVNCVKPQFMNSDKEASYETMYLYRISQNWLTSNPEDATQIQQQNPEVNKGQNEQSQWTKMTDCTICLDKKAEVVWMPCGHLTVCMECCSFMFQKRNMNCVLCKKTPEQIYVIDTNEREEMQKSQKSQIEGQDNEQKMKRLNSFNTSIDQNDVSVVSNSVMFSQEKRIESKKELLSPQKKDTLSPQKKKKQKAVKLNKKIAFTVLEGYNVKII